MKEATELLRFLDSQRTKGKRKKKDTRTRKIQDTFYEKELIAHLARRFRPNFPPQFWVDTLGEVPHSVERYVKNNYIKRAHDKLKGLDPEEKLKKMAKVSFWKKVIRELKAEKLQSTRFSRKRPTPWKEFQRASEEETAFEKTAFPIIWKDLYSPKEYSLLMDVYNSQVNLKGGFKNWNGTVVQPFPEKDPNLYAIISVKHWQDIDVEKLPPEKPPKWDELMGFGQQWKAETMEGKVLTYRNLFNLEPYDIAVRLITNPQEVEHSIPLASSVKEGQTAYVLGNLMGTWWEGLMKEKEPKAWEEIQQRDIEEMVPAKGEIVEVKSGPKLEIPQERFGWTQRAFVRARNQKSAGVTMDWSETIKAGPMKEVDGKIVLPFEPANRPWFRVLFGHSGSPMVNEKGEFIGPVSFIRVIKKEKKKGKVIETFANQVTAAGVPRIIRSALKPWINKEIDMKKLRKNMKKMHNKLKKLFEKVFGVSVAEMREEVWQQSKKVWGKDYGKEFYHGTPINWSEKMKDWAADWFKKKLGTFPSLNPLLELVKVTMKLSALERFAAGPYLRSWKLPSEIQSYYSGGFSDAYYLRKDFLWNLFRGEKTARIFGDWDEKDREFRRKVVRELEKAFPNRDFRSIRKTYGYGIQWKLKSEKTWPDRDDPSRFIEWDDLGKYYLNWKTWGPYVVLRELPDFGGKPRSAIG